MAKLKLNSSVESELSLKMKVLSEKEEIKDEKPVEKEVPAEDEVVEEQPAEAEAPVEPMADVVLSPDGTVQATTASAQVTVDPTKTVEIAITEKKEADEELPPVEEEVPAEEEVVEEQPAEAEQAPEEAPVEPEPRVIVSIPVDGSLQVQAGGKDVSADAEGNVQVAITETFKSRKINIRHQAIFEGRSLSLKENVVQQAGGNVTNNGFNNFGQMNDNHGSVSGTGAAVTQSMTNQQQNIGVGRAAARGSTPPANGGSQQASAGNPPSQQQPAASPAQTTPPPAKQPANTQNGAAQQKKQLQKKNPPAKQANRPVSPEAAQAAADSPARTPAQPAPKKVRGQPNYKPNTTRVSKAGKKYVYNGRNVTIYNKDGSQAYSGAIGQSRKPLKEYVEDVLRSLKYPVNESFVKLIQESINPDMDVEYVSELFPLSLIKEYNRDDLQLKESSLGAFKAASNTTEKVCLELLEFYAGYAYERTTFRKSIMEACLTSADGIDRISEVTDDTDDVLDLLEDEIFNYTITVEAAKALKEEADRLEESKHDIKPVLKENNHASFILESFIVDDCHEDRSVYTSLSEEVKVDSLRELAKEILVAISDKLEQIDSSSADKSRGDIKQLKDLPSIQEAITKIEALIERDENALPQYGQFINIVIKSILFINQYSTVFKEAYRNKKTLMILKYESLILSIISCVSYFLSTVINYRGNGVSLRDIAPDNFLEFAPLLALEAFNKSVESGEFKTITNDVSVLREYYLEIPVETMGNILESTDYLPMIVNGIKSLASGVDTTKLANLLYKTAGVVILLFSLRDVFYTLFRMKTKVSEMLAGIGLFANMNNGGNVLNKLSSFASKFKPDASACSDLAKREIEDENRKMLSQVKMAQTSAIAAPKVADVTFVQPKSSPIVEPEERPDSFFGVDF